MKNRFEYPFKENYLTIDGVRLHYVDESPNDGQMGGERPVIWLMHGMPMWSYVYRKVIPPLVKAGYRCIAPDLMGFGLSDKPDDESQHTLQRHVELMQNLMLKLKLDNIVVVGQDWGGPISLRYAIQNQSKIFGIVLLNTFIQRFPQNENERKREGIITGPLPKIYEILFKSGRLSSFLVNRLDVFRNFVWLKWRTGNPSKALGAGFRRPVHPLAMEQYRAPNNESGSRAGITAFAKAIPNHRQHENASYIDEIRPALEQWSIPATVIFPDGDMAWKPEEGRSIANVLQNADFHLIKNTGHYIQEDASEEVSEKIINFLKMNT